MWSWIQSIVLSLIIIVVIHYLWISLRDTFTKPIIKPLLVDKEVEAEREKIMTQMRENEKKMAAEDEELTSYLQSKINVLNTTSINNLDNDASSSDQKEVSQN